MIGGHGPYSHEEGRDARGHSAAQGVHQLFARRRSVQATPRECVEVAGAPGLIDPWSDRKLLPGEVWGEEIDRALERADLILFLVSDDFIASEYCWGVEVRRAMERQVAREAHVVPIVVRDCDWHEAPFGKLQALPAEGRPVTLWPDEDQAWADVARRLRRWIADRVRVSGAGSKVKAEAAGTGTVFEPDPTRYLEALEQANSFVRLRGVSPRVAR